MERSIIFYRMWNRFHKHMKIGVNRMSEYRKIAEELIDAVGGRENVHQ